MLEKVKLPLPSDVNTCPLVDVALTSPKSPKSVTPAAVVAGAHAEPFHCKTWF